MHAPTPHLPGPRHASPFGIYLGMSGGLEPQRTPLQAALAQPNQPVYWLEPGTIDQTAGAIEGWTGAHGTTIDLEQATPANQPTYVASHADFGGQPVAYFDTNTKHLTEVSTAALVDEGAYTLLWVMKANQPGAGQLVSPFIDSGGTLVQTGFRDTGGGATPRRNTYSQHTATHSDVGPWTGEAVIGCDVFDPANGRRTSFENGACVGAVTHAAGAGTWSGRKIYMGQNGGATSAAGYWIAEVIRIPGALSDAERRVWEVYLSSRYSIALVELPAVVEALRRCGKTRAGWIADHGVSLTGALLDEWTGQGPFGRTASASGSERPTVANDNDFAGREALQFANAEFMTTDEAASTWRLLHDGTGATAVIAFRKDSGGGTDDLIATAVNNPNFSGLNLDVLSSGLLRLQISNGSGTMLVNAATADTLDLDVAHFLKLTIGATSAEVVVDDTEVISASYVGSPASGDPIGDFKIGTRANEDLNLEGAIPLVWIFEGDVVEDPSPIVTEYYGQSYFDRLLALDPLYLLRGDDTTFDPDTLRVSSWNDQGANGDDFTNATEDEQPTLVHALASLNDQPALRFEETSTATIFRNLESDARDRDSTDLTLYWVLDRDVAADADLTTAENILRDNGTSGIVYLNNYPAGFGMGVYEGAHRTSLPPISGPQVIALVFDATAGEAQFYRNGKALGPALAYDGTFWTNGSGNILCLGAVVTSHLSGVTAYIAEHGAFQAAFDADRLALLHAYADERYGVISKANDAEYLRTRLLELADWDLLLIPDPRWVTAAEAGSYLEAIQDLSGNGADAIQTTDAERPRLVVGANGKWAIDFDGADDNMEGSFAATIDTDDGVDVFVANDTATGTTDGYFDSGPTNAATNTGLMVFRESGNIEHFRNVASDALTPATTAGVWKVTSGANIETDRRIWINGGDLGVATPANRSALLNVYRIGTLFNGSYPAEVQLGAVGLISGSGTDQKLGLAIHGDIAGRLADFYKA